MTEAEYNNIVLTKQLVREVLKDIRPIDKRVRRIDWLIRLGADKNARIYGKSLLSHAIFNKEEKVAEALWKSGANEWVISAKEAEILGKKLFVEVEKGDFEKVKELIEMGAMVDVYNEDKWSSLLVASSKGYENIVELLIENGADVDRKNGDKMSCLQSACLGGHLKVAQVLIKNNAKINEVTKNNETALMLAVEKGNFDIVKLLVKEKAEKNAKDCYGETALMKAVKKNDNLDIVRYLIENGAEIDETNNEGLSALMIASCAGNVDVVKELIGFGADVKIRDNRGQSVLDKMKFFYSSDKVRIWEILESSNELEKDEEKGFREPSNGVFLNNFVMENGYNRF